jgi:NAD(P)-dependent dehydrogenase (short-subunit alcohol dehydrogenase family)
MKLDYSGRHIVVTGGTGALGSAVVGLLLESGAECHIPCHDQRELDRCGFKGHARVHVAMGLDLTDEGHVEAFYSGLGGGLGAGAALWASIHIAGGFAMGPAEGVSKAEFVGMMQLNALTCFLCCREAVRRMKGAADGKRQMANGAGGGRIVNVGARPGLIPELGAQMVAYTASKAAVLAMTQALGAEVAADGIWVNAVVPSIMDTPANRKAMPTADHAKWATVEGVASTIAFLASPQNRVTRGACVPVYGGA